MMASTTTANAGDVAMASGPVLIVLLDALRYDYLSHEDTPFLYALSRKGLHVRTLTPGYGFCERSEILTGADASITGNFAAYTYAPDQSPFQHGRYVRTLLAVLDYCAEAIPRALPRGPALFFDKVHRYGLSRLQRVYRRFRDCYDWNRIPLRFFHLFALTEDARNHTEPQAFSLPSIYDLLRDRGLSWHHGFQDLATDMLDPYDVALRKLYAAFRESHSFYCFAIGHIDTNCHKRGTSQDARGATVRLVDTMAKEMYEEFMDANPGGQVIFFGDHGMLDVNQVFDAEGELLQFFKDKGWKAPRDIVYFLDSTMVRLWGEKAEECRSLVSNGDWSKYGVVVDEALASKFGILNASFNYGDLIWWANPGVAVFPDFFRRVDPPMGMHGYDINVAEHKGLAIAVGPNIKPRIIEEGSLLDIAPTVETMLGLAPPDQVVGSSWV